MQAPPALCGRGLSLRPGQEPGVVGARALPVQALLAGRDAATAPLLLSRLFSLCAQAHGVAAELAIGAAQSGSAGIDAEQRRRLHVEMFGETLRHLWIDWPQYLSGQPVDQEGLEQLARLRRLLNDGGDLREALSALLFGRDPQVWLRRRAWGRGLHPSAAAIPMRALSAARELASEVRIDAGNRLEALRDPAAWQRIAETALATPTFCERPELDGVAMQTGAFARCTGRHGRAAVRVLERLLDRLEDLAVLVIGLDELASEALSPVPGVGAAWVDTARGRLLHAVELDAAGKIRNYRIVAPTDWNFHPDGALARAATRLPAEGSVRAASLLGLAVDPCVQFTVENTNQVAGHA